jgi:hypothetical protein
MEAKQHMRSIKLLIFASLIFASCKSTQSTSVVEKIRVDTVHNIRTVEKFKAIHDTLTIENPCDSLGFLTRFYSKITIPQGKVIIRSENGNIKATIDLDSVANVYDSKYKSKYNQEVKLFEKEVVKNVVPTWAIVTIFFESLIIIGYIYFRFINPFK